MPAGWLHVSRDFIEAYPLRGSVRAVLMRAKFTSRNVSEFIRDQDSSRDDKRERQGVRRLDPGDLRELLVPMIFEPYAVQTCRAAGCVPPAEAVLETAAGTGVLTRAIAARLVPKPISLRQTSTSRCSTRHGNGKSRQGYAWQQADALALPFDDRSFRRRRLPVRRDVLSRQGRRASPKCGGCCATEAITFSLRRDKIDTNEFITVVC